MFWDNFYSACIKKGTKPNPLAKELQIASGSMTAWKGGKLPNGETLLKIADYLDVSVDYLLGRTDKPQTVGGHSIQTGSIGDNSSNSDTSVKISDTVQQTHLDETEQQLVQAFKTLDFIGKSKVMGLVAELISK